MSVLTRPLTYDDLCQMPADGNRYEIIDGELLVSPAPSRKHQEIAGRLFLLFGTHVAAGGQGKVYFAPVDARLTAHDVVQPDLLFIRRERLDLYGEQAVDGPPDIVVEILSTSTRAVDLIRKAALYARAGVPEYWAVDPDEPRLRLFVLKNGTYVERPPDHGRLRSTVLPELEIDLDVLVADLA